MSDRQDALEQVGRDVELACRLYRDLDDALERIQEFRSTREVSVALTNLDTSRLWFMESIT